MTGKKYFNNNLVPYFQSVGVDLPKNTLEFLENSVQLRKANKGEVLLKHLQYECFIRFVISGIIKISKHTEVESYVYDFREGNNFLSDTVSLFEHIPSSFSMETITECVWLEIPYCDIITLLQNDLNLNIAISKLLNLNLQQKQDSNSFFLAHNAKERYEIFCIEKKNVLKNASLGDIASYLRVTQQSLSRIRKELVISMS